MSKPVWGIIGFGEAGSAFAHHISGQLGDPVRVTDPLLNTPYPPASIRQRLKGSSILAVRDIPELMTQCDIVLSLVTPHVAPRVAAQAAASPQHGLFIDFNSVAPTEKQESATHFANNSYADGAILGSISTGVARIPLALAGPRAADAHTLLAAIGLRTAIIGSEVGDASALKMCRSIFMKGIECLLVETALAAARFGITRQVLESVEQTLTADSFQAAVNMLLTTHAVHCGRRSDEMQHVALMLEQMGLPNTMSIAARDLLATSYRAGLPDHFQGVVPDDSGAVVEYLSDVYRQGGQS